MDVEAFERALANSNPANGDQRRWVYVPYDQLSDGIGPLAQEAPGALGIVLIESPAKAARRPYHRQKLALVLANQRHFALEQAARGVRVRYVVDLDGYAEALRPMIDELGPLRVMEPAERELRAELAPLVEAGGLEQVPHEGWLSTREQFEASTGAEPPWRMDRFYRRMRADTGLLMEDGKPVGGKFSFDADNRRPWKGPPDDPAAPAPPRFEPDAITREVGALIERDFADHPGRLDLTTLPATIEDAERLWSFALEECLPAFGPYEDAMSTRSRGLFHTRVSGLLNLHRLLPRRVVEDVAAADGKRVPLASAEGFVRQVLGWREFVRHVHGATDGFRKLTPGGGEPNVLEADWPLPPAYWGEASGLACLDGVVADLWDEGYTHHIPRLMVLSNIATLLGANPRELSDWFWVAYTDAYDWVVEPNVLAMGTFATGPLMTTKPYVSGAAYIDRMGDYCGDCRFHPKQTCPLTSLYWSFLERNRECLAGNHRMGMPLRSLAKRSDEKRARDAEVLERVRARLGAGEALEPEDLPG